jgi:hypothetical protein
MQMPFAVSTQSIRADVPVRAIGVSFKGGMAASSPQPVSFSFIHSNDMPGILALTIPGFVMASFCVPRTQRSA